MRPHLFSTFTSCNFSSEPSYLPTHTQPAVSASSQWHRADHPLPCALPLHGAVSKHTSRHERTFPPHEQQTSGTTQSCHYSVFFIDNPHRRSSGETISANFMIVANPHSAPTLIQSFLFVHGVVTYQRPTPTGITSTTS